MREMRERTSGILLVLASAVFFALATVGAKYATQTGGASALHVTMARFIIGLAIAVPMVIRDWKSLKPASVLWVLLRAGTNVGAVFLFFLGIQHTTVSKANLLNMTYPVFVFVLSPFVTGEREKPVTILLLVVTMLGVWNVVRPENLSSLSDFALGDLLALGSGLLAGLSIAVLRRARATDSSSTILFYVMALGAFVNVGLIIAGPLPPARLLFFAGLAGLSGALGQLALTVGFAHVSAQGGSLLSTSRILVAVVLGVVLFGDRITPRTVLGAILIVGSLVATTLVRPRGEGRPTVSRDRRPLALLRRRRVRYGKP